MAAGSLAPNSANDIKQAELALVGLAGQNWPISNTPYIFCNTGATTRELTEDNDGS
jgi:hypothetical protein